MRVCLAILVIVLLCLGGTSWAEDSTSGGASFAKDQNSRIAQLEQRVQYLEERLATVLHLVDHFYHGCL